LNKFSFFGFAANPEAEERAAPSGPLDNAKLVIILPIAPDAFDFVPRVPNAFTLH
jgi:hypothetical protein